jgi:16S rRNA C967 or C1407 C5-methylase (RsmB/RsmF family)
LAHQLPGVSPVPWSLYGSYLERRPSFTFDPLFHAGCYYVQEASSMFLEQALRQTTDLAQPLNVLDLCAAPGGKTTHLQSLLSEDSLLVSNEVIRSRAAVLKQNCVKWGTQNVVITNNDPQHFNRLEGFFDVVVVDAPCSGSGLFRRDEEAIEEWSPDNVQLCCGRQKRILADVFPALKEGGVLIYSTCSYSKEENEAIADWLATELQMENLTLQTEKDWHIVETTADKTNAKGYRFFPDKVKGEGFL